jgi:hypothetical protein
VVIGLCPYLVTIVIGFDDWKASRKAKAPVNTKALLNHFLLHPALRIVMRAQFNHSLIIPEYKSSSGAAILYASTSQLMIIAG